MRRHGMLTRLDNNRRDTPRVVLQAAHRSQRDLTRPTWYISQPSCIRSSTRIRVSISLLAEVAPPGANGVPRIA
jgi:hypothetical protein